MLSSCKGQPLYLDNDLRLGNIVLNERNRKISIYCVLPEMEMGSNLWTHMQ